MEAREPLAIFFVFTSRIPLEKVGWGLLFWRVGWSGDIVLIVINNFTSLAWRKNLLREAVFSLKEKYIFP